MLDFPSMLRVKLSVVDRIHPQSDKFAMGVQNNDTGDSKLNDSPGKIFTLYLNLKLKISMQQEIFGAKKK